MIRYLSPFKAQKLMQGENEGYVVPVGTVAQIRALTFHNTTADAVFIEVYLIPSNVLTTENAQRLVWKSLVKNQSYLCPELINHALTEGMRVILKGEGVNAMLSVMEQPV